MLKIAYSPVYKYSLPPGHRFPMEKYELLPEQLLYEGTITESNFFHPSSLEERDLLTTHAYTYWEKLKKMTLSRKEVRAIGFPLLPALIDRGRYIAKGTIDCALYALKYGIAMNIAGGTHHAFRDRGEGFCVFNDIAIAANFLLGRCPSNGFTNEGIQKIMVVDLDVHQGNGTAKIFENDTQVYTFSMHGMKNYPLRKEQSDLDIGLPDNTKDDQYLEILEKTLPRIIEEQQPDFMFYLSGVDVLESDKLGRLGMTIEGCKRRDRFIFDQCKQDGIPVAVSMGGGYSEKISTIIDAHANTFREALNIYF